MKAQFRWMLTYLGTALLGLTLAYSLSARWMGRAVSQTNPLPPTASPVPAGTTAEAGGGQSPVAPVPGAVASPPAGSLEPAVVEPSPPANGEGAALSAEGYVYDPTGRRDPFAPYKAIRIGRTGPLLEPLQMQDLEKLSLIGILWDVNAPRALVKDPDGKLHTLVKNTKLGRNNGYVAVIREGEVVVIETVDEDGKSFKRTKILEFKK